MLLVATQGLLSLNMAPRLAHIVLQQVATAQQLQDLVAAGAIEKARVLMANPTGNQLGCSALGDVLGKLMPVWEQQARRESQQYAAAGAKGVSSCRVLLSAFTCVLLWL